MKLSKIFGIVLSLHVGVILLVMFQPSCQTIEKKNPAADNDLKVETSTPETPDAGFNSGINNQSASPGLTEKPKTEKVEFSSPTRPNVGELIVPGQTAPGLKPLPPILPESDPLSPSVGLRPTGLSIYKIERGDTLWGVARKKGISLSALLSSNPNLDKDGKLSIGQEIMIPENSAPSSVSQGTPSSAQDSFPTTTGSTYVVKAGDSLSRIARNQGVSLSALMSINGMSPTSIIRVGQVINLPDSGVSSPIVSDNSNAGIVPQGASTYTVQKGDNLTRISAIHGTTVQQIMEWNGLSDAGKIRVGQVLIVSGEQSGSNQPVESTLPTATTPESDSPDGSSVEGFFKDASEDRPIIDVTEENP